MFARSLCIVEQFILILTPHLLSFLFSYPGGWGKPPTDEYGNPLYGDVFGVYANDAVEFVENFDKVGFVWIIWWSLYFTGLDAKLTLVFFVRRTSAGARWNPRWRRSTWTMRRRTRM